MDKQISMMELRRWLGVTIDEVRIKKTSFTITRHGKPVARLVPVDEEDADD